MLHVVNPTRKKVPTNATEGAVEVSVQILKFKVPGTSFNLIFYNESSCGYYVLLVLFITLNVTVRSVFLFFVSRVNDHGVLFILWPPLSPIALQS